MDYKNRLREIIRQVREIDIISKKEVVSHFSGEYKSLFRGHGLEFDQVRMYTDNDDVRSIDWNVSARTGEIHVKTFHEEKENTIFFICDISSSLDYASSNNFIKKDVLVQIMAMIAFSAVKNNDKIGLLLFDDQVRCFVPPKKGRNHVLDILERLLLIETSAKETNIKEVFDFFSRVQKRRSHIFFLSDMITKDNFENVLYVLSKKHTITIIKINDSFEINLKKMGHVYMEDSETGDRILVDISSKKIKQEYEKNIQRKNDTLKKQLNRIGVKMINIENTENYIQEFSKKFRELY